MTLLGVWTTWLTPVWIVSAGVTLGVVVLLLLFGDRVARLATRGGLCRADGA